MGNATAETLYRIAGRKAAQGHGWDALNAQLAGDALFIAAEMEKSPRSLLDLSPLRSLDFPETGLAGVAAAYRRQLLTGLDSWGIAGAVAQALPAIELTEAPLDPAEAGAFADTWLAGRDLAAFAAAESARAGRFAALANRLYAAGDYPAAGRSAQAADRAALAAHYGAEAAVLGDRHLAALRTALLLAEDLLTSGSQPADSVEAGRQARRVHDEVNLTDKPIHWEAVSFLS
ncbi:hypothetical protein Achl_4159 (plasmid) [Pseudarthrobacter chlorophenolicus A6]|uniref:Uncharacterized protein n=1 Tax=Pseudarthrobacter chlorophenolicus (strain ATCC 700700 / DSM 12829 / CIP 107037 / JCM 12360 / KCTC 9906 / NCIMB 13794 / A6) TaxID=452863 RepID=B8HI63_PSECP|nr:hypothetical protein [Pseudarthrobacter chlorophenolicus]ACL42110.1 hypothetical protein Achl_4159 [Pseudarthrobacter chlorophenolicus A6]SDQ13561.1 hypothetical protein SAMN04489738_0218 [Pseudarthrobacter chlorophenolicus]